MRLSRQFQACLFFFYEMILRAQKHSQANINQQNKIKQTLNKQGNNFLRAQFSKRVKVACFAFWCFFSTQNLFAKKYKQAWNCLDNLILLYYCWLLNISNAGYKEKDLAKNAWKDALKLMINWELKKVLPYPMNPWKVFRYFMLSF